MTGKHELKCWVEPFSRVWAGDKPFEFRKDDRNYQEGDWVLLKEWDHERGAYTDREITDDVGYVLRSPAFGMPDGYCAFALIDIIEWPHGVTY